MSPLTNLIQLNVSKNKLTTFQLPDSCSKNLRHLNASDNELTTLQLPDSCPELECLNVSDNKLTTLQLPDSCLNLTYLNVSNNKLTTLQLPDSCLNLTYLNASDNELTTLQLPDSCPKLEYLYASNNELKTLKLPDSCLNLIQLNVSKNKLTTLQLPDSCPKLTDLNVSNNELTTLQLPDSCPKLAYLSVSKNKLMTLQLPDSCPNLTYLYASNNELTTLQLPEDSCPKLTHLHVSNNELTTLQLPDSCPNLTRLYVSNNPNFSILPLSLSQCYLLMDIDREGTSISEDLVREILVACRRRRNTEATGMLPHRLQVWSAAAIKQFHFSFIENFSKQEIQFLSEWLLRLEKTKDFNSSHQPGLALLVCQMVSSLNTDSEFKELFFSQVETNLECCDDRVAMSFNEIFVFWQLRSLLNSQLGDKEQLNLMIAAAKTLTLHKAIANKCTGRQGQAESVEIYLYYQLALKETLHLLTGIYQMRHSNIGKKDWISEKELENYVNANYLETLYDLPIFQAMVKKDPFYSPLLSQIENKWGAQLAQLYDEKETKKNGEYVVQCNSVIAERKSEKKKNF